MNHPVRSSWEAVRTTEGLPAGTNVFDIDDLRASTD